jgi:hypothetical protein
MDGDTFSRKNEEEKNKIRKKMSNIRKGRNVTEKTKIEMSRSRGGRSFICVETKEFFKTQREAERALDVDHSDIGKVLKGKHKQAKGYHFMYVDEGKDVLYV